jgi:heterodisulfide reductase subunit C1
MSAEHDRQAAEFERRSSDGELLERSRAELRDVPDERLVAAYERARDESVEAEDGRGRRYPNIRRLYATAFEREKDRREVRALAASPDVPEVQAWYEEAARKPCTWWLDNHLVARHALKSCMFCGVCTSLCPAAEFYEEYNPRTIVDVALSKDEARIVELLRSDLIWFCGQCGSCRPKCARQNNVMSLISSLRLLAQLKGFHLASVRGRQQYAARHLWGGNFWNRGLSMYFRNAVPEAHADFGPRYARYFEVVDEQMARVGAHPDRDGGFGGRKTDPATLAELRGCVRQGGTLLLWNRIEDWAAAQAKRLGLDLDEYLDKVRREG